MIGADLWMIRKSSFFIGVPSAFFSMPLVSICASVESSSVVHWLAATSTVPCVSASMAFSWLPVKTTLPK